MKVRYTRRALRQLAQILDYVDARSPQGAANIKRRLLTVIDLLADHPNSGRLTNKNDIRRAVVRFSTDRTRRGLSSMGFGTLPADRLRARAHGKYVRINHAKLAAAKGRTLSKQLILFRKR